VTTGQWVRARDVSVIRLPTRRTTPCGKKAIVARLNIVPEDAIIRQARLGHHNLIVMGVGRPAGESSCCSLMTVGKAKEGQCREVGCSVPVSDSAASIWRPHFEDALARWLTLGMPPTLGTVSQRVRFCFESVLRMRKMSVALSNSSCTRIELCRRP
jgi:hypothetical protein